MRTEFSARIHLISILVFLFAAALVARLYMIQVVQGSEFSDRAERQYVRSSGDLFDRGSIFFEDKDGRLISGATLKSGFIVVLNPGMLGDPEDAYERLSEIIDIDKDIFLLRAGKKDDPYEEVAAQVSKEKAERIEKLGIVGVDLYRDRWRFYPGGTLAAQTLGFVGYQGNALSGRYGLERYYNDILLRENGNVYINFFAAVFSNANKIIFDNSRGREGNIIVSLEPSVQLFLERLLENINETWTSSLAGGIVINPKNGEVYALGVHPTFDVNAFQNAEDPRIFQNPIVESVYEMGSIMKPLTVAAGIDSGAITPETTYYDGGFIELDGSRISNFDGKGRGTVPMQEVLNQSLNTGAAFVMLEVGKEKFREYMLAYGLGKETGIDLPNESAGLVDNLNSPRALEYATASFGQGIATTPIAMVRALSALANGGILVTPHVAKKITYESGLSKDVSFADEEQVLKPETVEEVTRMLVETVDKALLGGTVALPRYSIAAKTGTAQIAKMKERGYYDDRFLHAFFGYFPAYDPEFLIFLYTVEPRGVRYASQTLTYPFMDMVNFLINYYEIPPDR